MKSAETAFVNILEFFFLRRKFSPMYHETSKHFEERTEK
jgi:hypothetical protein